MAAFTRFSEHLKVDVFFIKQTLIIMHMKVTYIKGSFRLTFEQQNQSKINKTILRSLLKNLFLQKNVQKLNICGCGYYTMTD